MTPAPAPTHGNYIGGEWTPAASGAVFENRNPADTRELIGSFADSGPPDVARAVAAAREACVQALEVFSEWKSIYID